MAKYAILHCYNDLNRGDLGIVISTVLELKKIDPNAEVIGVSCFSKDDEDFKYHHEELKLYIPNIYPAIYGTLGITIHGKYNKSIIFKILAYFLENIRYQLGKFLPHKLFFLSLTNSERETLKEILSCDACISKGGSIFTDSTSLRSKIALNRLCRIYYILNRFKCKYYILGQSFGPVHSYFGRKYVNSLLNNAQTVYLRENFCSNKYKYLKLKQSNIRFSNDAGFLLEPKPIVPSPIDKSLVNIGITVRNLDHKNNFYIKVMTEFFIYLTLKRGFIVHIFRQVEMIDEPDNLTALTIINSLPQQSVRQVINHTERYSPQQLSWLYGMMDAFVGTRLHSTIFAMRAGTPSLGIVYHGTKMQGIFNNIGVSDLVISGDFNSDVLIERFEYLFDNRDEIKSTIKHGVGMAQIEMRNAIKSIVLETSSLPTE